MTADLVGIVGAGVMGSGLAHALAQHGHPVVLVDRSDEILDRSRSDIQRSLRLQRMLGQSAPGESTADILGRVRFTTDYAALADARILIENVTEKWEVKHEVHLQIDQVCSDDCLVVINTSAISITRIASLHRRPQRVIGIHFMNPVPLKPVVEVIPGVHTDGDTVVQAQSFLTGLGKRGIVVQDMPGFVSNRVLMLMINEAISLLQDGVAGAEDVDTIFRECFGHKMGPLETADLIGLDTILYSIMVLFESYGDPKFRPTPLLRKMVDAGLYGCKSGRGFYRYDGSERKAEDQNA
jgi:3-hydroxybutyryl-CoA dehydrogenase